MPVRLPRALAVVALASSLAACGGHSASPENVARAWSKAINAGDNEAAARLFAPGAVVVQGPEIVLRTHAGQVFTREQLMDSVWDYSFAADAGTVTVHMRRLRTKLETDPSRPRHLKTVWGVGYKFEP